MTERFVSVHVCVFGCVCVCLSLCLSSLCLPSILFEGVKISVTDEEAAQESSGNIG